MTHKNEKKHTIYGGKDKIAEALVVPIDKSECAFYFKDRSGDSVCSEKEIIEKMKKFLFDVDKVIANSDKDVIEKMKKKYECKSESCVLLKDEVKKKIGENLVNVNLSKNFKPNGPWNSFQWFSNFNIDEVLGQFVIKYKDKKFRHIPFQMRDFESMGTELATIDLAKEYKNKEMECFGVVLNTDRSSGSGQHWFCLFGDFTKEPITIEYFNSAGTLPLVEVEIWMKKTKNKLQKQLNKKVDDIITSRIVHQQDTHSCGAYSIYYIMCRLEGIPWTFFKSNRVPDKTMHQFRKNVLFRTEI